MLNGTMRAAQNNEDVSHQAVHLLHCHSLNIRLNLRRPDDDGGESNLTAEVDLPIGRSPSGDHAV